MVSISLFSLPTIFQLYFHLCFNNNLSLIFIVTAGNRIASINDLFNYPAIGVCHIIRGGIFRTPISTKHQFRMKKESCRCLQITAPNLLVSLGPSGTDSPTRYQKFC